MSQKITLKFEISNRNRIAIIIIMMILLFLQFLMPLYYGTSILSRASGPSVNIDDVRNRIRELEKKSNEYDSKMWPSLSQIGKMKPNQLDALKRDKVYVAKYIDVRCQIEGLNRSISGELKRQEYEKQKPKAYFCVGTSILLELFWLFAIYKIICYLRKQNALILNPSCNN